MLNEIIERLDSAISQYEILGQTEVENARIEGAVQAMVAIILPSLCARNRGIGSRDIYSNLFHSCFEYLYGNNDYPLVFLREGTKNFLIEGNRNV